MELDSNEPEHPYFTVPEYSCMPIEVQFKEQQKEAKHLASIRNLVLDSRNTTVGSNGGRSNHGGRDQASEPFESWQSV